jgi:hypothetical protein
MKKKKPISHLLSNGMYLPPFMRDFHDQKNLFKAVGRIVARDQAENPEDFIKKRLPNWLDAHIYVVDYFLWFMAKHGYTLQKSRQSCEFEDIQEAINKSWEDELELVIKCEVPPNTASTLTRLSP